MALTSVPTAPSVVALPAPFPASCALCTTRAVAPVGPVMVPSLVVTVAVADADGLALGLTSLGIIHVTTGPSVRTRTTLGGVA